MRRAERHGIPFTIFVWLCTKFIFDELVELLQTISIALMLYCSIYLSGFSSFSFLIVIEVHMSGTNVFFLETGLINGL